MKIKPALAASLFATIAMFALNAGAAPDVPEDAKAETVAAQKMRPHSHVQEKTGIPQSVPEATPNKPNAANDRTRHFHPRDGK